MSQSIEELKAEIAKLQAENLLLKTHAPYGIFTRAAFEIEKRNLLENGQYVVFGDVDNMHALNIQHGYENVNQMIRSALQVRTSDLLLTSLWFSGDEFVFVIRGNPDGFCNRIKESFSAYQMGITLAHAPIDGNIDAAIQIAAEQVQQQKVNR